MNKYDIILVVVLLILSFGSYAGLYMYTSGSEISDGLATVYYKDEQILEISLEDEVNTLETANEALEASLPISGDYTPGIYYGMSEANGYYATVVINENGGIELVILNALYTMDGPDEIEGTEDDYVTTKQALGGDYGMLGITGKGWFEHANELAAALVANQGWSADWDMYDAGSHFKFVVDDEEVVLDGIAGVTIGIEGFKTAFEEAIGQAE